MSIFQANFSDWRLRFLLWNFPKWKSMDLSDDQSKLVRVVACCHQAASHYLNHCWPNSISPYGITRQQWIKIVTLITIWIVKIWYALKWFDCKINHVRYSNSEENISTDIIICTVHAEGQSLPGSRSSADPIMTMFGYRLYENGTWRVKDLSPASNKYLVEITGINVITVQISCSEIVLSSRGSIYFPQLICYNQSFISANWKYFQEICMHIPSSL